MDYGDPVGKTAMDAEGCKAFLPGITEGWETLEDAGFAVLERVVAPDGTSIIKARK